MPVPVNAISVVVNPITGNDEVEFDVSSTAANDDWIRAARLNRRGHKNKLKAMEEEQMYVETDEES